MVFIVHHNVPRFARAPSVMLAIFFFTSYFHVKVIAKIKNLVHNDIMQIYLIKDLPGKGKAGDIVNVNDGYGRNFVIKNGFGKVVDNAVLSQVKAKQQSCEFHKQEDIAAVKEICKRLEQIKVTMSRKVGANGKMFGAVTASEIMAEVNKLGFSIDKKNLVTETIKDLGSYKIKVKFNHGLSAEFMLEVIEDAN